MTLSKHCTSSLASFLAIEKAAGSFRFRLSQNLGFRLEDRHYFLHLFAGPDGAQVLSPAGMRWWAVCSAGNRAQLATCEASALPAPVFESGTLGTTETKPRTLLLFFTPFANSGPVTFTVLCQWRLPLFSSSYN